MNTFQLTNILNTDSFTKRLFLGVYARDEVPIKVKYPSCFIINTHNSNQPGEHWLAFFLNQDGSVEFFDPIGLSPQFYNLDKYLQIISKNKVFYTNQRLQGFGSNYCGVYCVYFLYQRSRGITFNNFYKDFENCFENDKFIKKYFKKFNINI